MKKSKEVWNCLQFISLCTNLQSHLDFPWILSISVPHTNSSLMASNKDFSKPSDHCFERCMSFLPHTSGFVVNWNMSWLRYNWNVNLCLNKGINPITVSLQVLITLGYFPIGTIQWELFLQHVSQMEDATQINFFIFIITIFYTGEQAVKKPFEIIASVVFFFFTWLTALIEKWRQ